MMLRNSLLLIVTLALLPACTPDPEERYAAELAEAVATEKTSNDLFLGLELNVPAKAFYDRCTVLNGQRLITMGSGGNRVDHQPTSGFERPVKMTFYPDFSEGSVRNRIVEAMNLEFIYRDWAPWNKDAQSPALMTDLVDWAESVFGDGFFVVDHPVHQKVLVQFKDNRRTAFWLQDQSIVRGRVTDMSLLPEEELAVVP